MNKNNFNGFFWFYYLLIAISGFLGLIEGLYYLLIGNKFILGYGFGNVLGLLIFILSIVALKSFIKNKYPKKTLVIPLYIIILNCIGLILTVSWIFTRAKWMDLIITYITTSLPNIIFSLFEIVFSVYLLFFFWKRLKNRKEHNQMIKSIIIKIVLVLLILILVTAVGVFISPFKFPKRTLLINLSYLLFYVLVIVGLYKIIKSINRKSGK